MQDEKRQLQRGDIVYDPGKGFKVIGCRCGPGGVDTRHANEVAAQTCSVRLRHRGGYSNWAQPRVVLQP